MNSAAHHLFVVAHPVRFHLLHTPEVETAFLETTKIKLSVCAPIYAKRRFSMIPSSSPKESQDGFGASWRFRFHRAKWCDRLTVWKEPRNRGVSFQATGRVRKKKKRPASPKKYPMPAEQPPLICWICGEPTTLETCKVDEYGLPVHDDCQALRFSRTGVPSKRESASVRAKNLSVKAS
jgi:hypothetical protein